jgi:hypothetical protein
MERLWGVKKIKVCYLHMCEETHQILFLKKKEDREG